MKKIPTLFERVFCNHKVVGIGTVPISGLEWVLEGEGLATKKIDGACAAIIDGKYYKRFDAKKGKKPPKNAIPCCDPDPVTGHWPHWVPVDDDRPSDKWFVEAINNTRAEYGDLLDGTYEAIGPHFCGNPYGIEKDYLIRHGEKVLDVPRTFDGIKTFLAENEIEGIVFWKDGEPQCKIKRKDFGFPWPVKGGAGV